MVGNRSQPEIRKGFSREWHWTAGVDRWRAVSIICCLPQGTLAVLALQLARQIHFQTSLPAGPWRVEHCSWCSPLDRFLSSPLRHPCSCEFSVPGTEWLGWEFLWARKHLWTHLRKRAIRGSLPFLSAVRGRGMGGSSIHPGCGPHLPPGSSPHLPWREPCRGPGDFRF